MMERPRSKSCCSSVSKPVAERRAFRLPAMDLMGASELFSSCPITRISRCHARRSSSRRARLTSERITRVWGTPCWRIELRRTSHRASLDIPIFAFDPAETLRLVNTAGERLLQQSSPRLLGKTAAELGVHSCLTCENESLVPLRFNSDARWLVRRSSFRQQGVPHTLVILSDVSRALREEERHAWQRLIRVMG